MQRSNDGGKTWAPVGNKFAYEGVPGTHKWYDGTPHPWEFKRVWRLEPSLSDPDSVYAGVEDAAYCFIRAMGGGIGRKFPGFASMGYRPNGSRGRACVCIRSLSIRPIRPESSSPSRRRGRFARDDGGKTWLRRSIRGYARRHIPDPTAEVGHCVHHIAMHPSRPKVLFMQKHWDVMRSDDAGDSWHEISGNLPTDFGFPIQVHAHEPDTVYVVPIKSDSDAAIRRRASFACIEAGPVGMSGSR